MKVMSKLSLLDKLKVLSDVTSSSGLFIVAIIFFVILASLLIITNTRTKKISKMTCIAIYGTISIITIAFYREQLFEMFDYMMDNFFIAVYFPNLAIYFAAIIATNIILWISIFNRKVTKWIRTINTVMFCIIHYLLILVIYVITTNKLDVFEQTSVYKNENAQALIELSSTIFIVWLLFLIIYKIIRIYQDNQVTEETINHKEPEKIIIREPIPAEPIVKTETIIKRKLPDSISKTEIPTIVRGNITPKKQPTANTNIIDFMKTPAPIDDNSYLTDIPNPILNNEPQFLDIMLQNQETKEPRKEQIPQPRSNQPQQATTKKKDSQLDILDGLLTLDDYKRVLAILKNYQKKQKENNQTQSVRQQMKLEDLANLYGKK